MADKERTREISSANCLLDGPPPYCWPEQAARHADTAPCPTAISSRSSFCRPDKHGVVQRDAARLHRPAINTQEALALAAHRAKERGIAQRGCRHERDDAAPARPFVDATRSGKRTS